MTTEIHFYNQGIRKLVPGERPEHIDDTPGPGEGGVNELTTSGLISHQCSWLVGRMGIGLRCAKGCCAL